MIKRKLTSKIPLTQGKYAIVDYEDIERLSNYEWCLSKYKYGYSSKIGYMHRFIMNVNDSKIHIDHINGNTFDNRKCNLRLCTNKQNIRNQKLHKNNTSGYKGVSWYKRDKKWSAEITINYKRIKLGMFDDPKEAYQAYCNKAKELFGEFFHP